MSLVEVSVDGQVVTSVTDNSSRATLTAGLAGPFGKKGQGGLDSDSVFAVYRMANREPAEGRP